MRIRITLFSLQPDPPRSVKEMEKEFADLQLELSELEREVDYHKSQRDSADPDDLFLPTTEGFVSSTKEKFEAFNALVVDMKNKFEQALVYFGEDPQDSGSPSVEELFNTFSTFLQSFAVSIVVYITQGLLHRGTPIVHDCYCIALTIIIMCITQNFNVQSQL